jgi:hypothetical protein
MSEQKDAVKDKYGYVLDPGHHHPVKGDMVLDHSWGWAIKAVAFGTTWGMVFLSTAFAYRIIATIP